ncbi:MAG: sulfotransferase domain-containing protein [Planctomycetota bacterium]
MTLPNFLYIGPPKSGSTWLYGALAQHPDVFVPELKDLYFFDRHYDRGIDWYGSQFDGGEDFAAIGEISHDYLFSAEACQRIARDLPEVKLITILREPKDRAISHYKYSLRFGNVRGSFEDAVGQNSLILELGLYSKYLRGYFDVFPAENIGVFWFDDLKADSNRFAASVFRFLGIDDSVRIDVEKGVNGQAVSRSVLLSRLARRSATLARTLGWTKLLGRAKNSAMLRSMLFRSTGGQSSPFDLSGADPICDSFYREDLAQLRELLPSGVPWSITDADLERSPE